jgi:hypothetical protein
MNKLDNETWEDYAFRNELFIIVYDENDKSIICDVIIPIHDKIIDYDTSDRYTTLIDKLLSIFGKHNLLPEIEEDFKKRQRLYDLKRFWTVEEKKIMPINRLKMYNRYKELVTKISETNKDELEELLNIKSNHPPSGTPDYDEWLYRNKYNCSERLKNDAKKRIEMYNTYIKNKDIYRQINEMEEKIKQLKSHMI